MNLKQLPWMSLGALALAVAAISPASAQQKSVAVTAIVEHPALDSVRDVNELAYQDLFDKELPNHEFLGEIVKDKLIYYPTVTREPFRNQGRITDLIENGTFPANIRLSPLDPRTDRVMLCGSTATLADL